MTYRALFLFGVVGVILIGPVMIWTSHIPDGWAWLWTMSFMVVAVAAVGKATSKRFNGVLIDQRNRVSLARTQAAVWTLVVLSAVAIAGERNLHEFLGHIAEKAASNGADPIAFNIPDQLLAIMGIAGFSLVASPVAMNRKTSAAIPTLAAAAAAVAKLPTSAPQGRLFARNDIDAASWSDLFVGDDVSNVGSTDLSKLQQFTVTAILIGVYAGELWGLFSLNRKVGSLPAVSDQFVALLGISHASYLGAKAVTAS